MKQVKKIGLLPITASQEIKEFEEMGATDPISAMLWRNREHWIYSGISSEEATAKLRKFQEAMDK